MRRAGCSVRVHAVVPRLLVCLEPAHVEVEHTVHIAGAGGTHNQRQYYIVSSLRLSPLATIFTFKLTRNENTEYSCVSARSKVE